MEEREVRVFEGKRECQATGPGVAATDKVPETVVPGKLSHETVTTLAFAVAGKDGSGERIGRLEFVGIGCWWDFWGAWGRCGV